MGTTIDRGVVGGEAALKAATKTNAKMGNVTLTSSCTALNQVHDVRDRYIRYILIVSGDFESSATKLSRIILSLSNFSKYAIVRINPSFKGMRGCHNNSSCALEISGRRCRGSFCGNGL